jgi:hypothetical protein
VRAVKPILFHEPPLTFVLSQTRGEKSLKPVQLTGHGNPETRRRYFADVGFLI